MTQTVLRSVTTNSSWPALMTCPGFTAREITRPSAGEDTVTSDTTCDALSSFPTRSADRPNSRSRWRAAATSVSWPVWTAVTSSSSWRHPRHRCAAGRSGGGLSIPRRRHRLGARTAAMSLAPYDSARSAEHKQRDSAGGQADVSAQAAADAACRPVVDHFVIHRSSPRSARDRGGHPIDLDHRVVHLLERVRIAVLDLNVAPLLGDHVEQRATSQRVRLPHDDEVARRDVADAPLVDLQRAPRRRVLHEGRRHLLADRQLGELEPPLGRLRLRRRRRDAALVTVAHREHDAHAGAEVMEDILDRPRGAGAGDAVQI